MPSLRTIIFLILVAAALLAILPVEQIQQIPLADQVGLLDLREWIRDGVTQLFHNVSEIAKDFINLFIGDVLEQLQQSAQTTIQGL